MNTVFFDELGLPQPEFVLDYEPRSHHGAQTAIMLDMIERILLKVRPSGVLVYGDTNSTLAGSLAAVKLNLPVFHVEAGLRSFNRKMPEEVNRVLTDHISTLLFAPTRMAVSHLAREGISDGVHLVGDVMCDVLRASCQGLVPPRAGSYIFCTLHRPSNVDEPQRLEAILEALNRSVLTVVLPLHPRTKSVMNAASIESGRFENIEFIPPLGYRECLAHQLFSRLVVTDSGGIQKEAYMLKKRCLTLREETEWAETLENGCNTLVGERLEMLPALIAQDGQPEFDDIYGDGQAASKIAKIIAENLE